MARKKKMLEVDIEQEEDGEEKIPGQSGSIRLGEFGSAVLQLAEEKGISEEKVIEVVEAALAAAYKKDYGKRGQVIRAEFDKVTKSAKYFLEKEVVDETMREFVGEELEEAEKTSPEKKGKKSTAVEVMESIPGDEDEEHLPRFNAERDMTLEEARAVKSDATLGETIDLPLEEQQEFGRVAAQTAKQVIIQRIREAERESMFAEYKSKEGTIVNGTIQRIDGRIVFVDLGKSVGALFPSEQMEGENYRIGQRIKVYILRVEADAKGPGITLSRAHAEMVRHLFTLEVPEIFAGTVEIKGVAREAGSRTKIAVFTAEEGVDPIGSCVGQKGTRVQAVIDELGGEKIDIIEWNEDMHKFIKAALSPAKVTKVDLNEEAKTAVVHVPEDQLSLAIGRKGQNVRLASKLTGLRIDIAGSGTKKSAETETESEIEGEDATVLDAESSVESPAELSSSVSESVNDEAVDKQEEKKNDE
ncbi:MAG: transcription termination/antitermination protein NusA [Candidatus Moraniibacteriota bacterium]|nr:MAG: transcription termination/antitermination protein NusA [Candidatus Moranbacteria bacterium]